MTKWRESPPEEQEIDERFYEQAQELVKDPESQYFQEDINWIAAQLFEDGLEQFEQDKIDMRSNKDED